MRRRIKPIVVAVFFSLFGLLLIIGHLHSTNTLKKELVEAKKTIPSVKASKVPQKSTSSKDKEFVLKPIIDVSGWQLPKEIDEAQIFYKNAAPYKPTFYWIDVEEETMSNMNKGVQAFRKELKRLGAKNVGIYIGTYFMTEQGISVKGFDAVWIPTYGSDSGYYEAAPQTELKYDLHQYTSQGYLPGFNQPLDLNQIAVNKDKKKTYEKLFGKVKE
ncbi:TPA: N-acetylmuramoyl-L-alanine amidase [Streptococcus agalactiae]|nr:N-acetylmuramoyl-L-alanine amidase [Streptococcus agalactiae]